MSFMSMCSLKNSPPQYNYSGSPDIDSNKKEDVSRKRKIQDVFNAQETVSKKMKKDEPCASLEKHHTLSIQSNPKAPYLDYFRQGIKKAEGRINYSSFSKFKIGEAIYFHNRKDGILCKIIFINPYKSFAEMLTAEGVLNMLPQLKNEEPSTLFEKALSIYKKFPNADKAKELGVIAIGVEFIRDKIPNRKKQT